MATQAMAMTGLTRGRAESFRAHNADCYEKQKSARRGPTPEVLFTKHLDNSRLVKADDPERRREMRTFSVMMGFLFLLVMTYVWQHFSAIEYGYRIESAKTQMEHLREENRQLQLHEAQLSDPERIDKIAKELGLDVPQPGAVVHPNALDSNAPVLAQANTVAPLLQ